MVRSLPKKVRDALDKDIKTLEQEQRQELAKEAATVVKTKDITLTKGQWARYYKTLGEIQAGLYKPMQTPDGGNAILIDNMLVLDNGSFLQPKIRSIVVAKNEQYMLDYLEVCRTIGGILAFSSDNVGHEIETLDKFIDLIDKYPDEREFFKYACLAVGIR